MTYGGSHSSSPLERPAYSLYISAPVLDAYHFRKPSIEINPGRTDVTEFVTVKVACGAARALDAIWGEYNR
jgi:NAD-dependent deacetylase